MKKNIYIARLDLGGTNIRLGVYSASNKQLKLYKKIVGSNKRFSVIIKLIAAMLFEAEKELKIKISALQAGIPGIVNGHKGIVYSSPHYPQWKNVSFASKLRHEIKIPVEIDNDANRLALIESKLGVGKNLNSFVMLTLGTGIGGGIIINKKIFHGDCGFAGEVGHTVIEADGNPCGC
ncbi:MAG: transcriptional regulator, partial [uncultured bacterium]